MIRGKVKLPLERRERLAVQVCKRRLIRRRLRPAEVKHKGEEEDYRGDNNEECYSLTCHRLPLRQLASEKPGHELGKERDPNDDDRGDAEHRDTIESRIISCQSRQREDCFQKAVIKRGLRRMRRSVLRARSSSSQ